MASNKKYIQLNPPQTILMGFALIIIIGTGLLSLPLASNSGQSVGFLNALFTSTSATCVTGLAVVNTLHQWTLFGQIVMLVLIHLGAMGFIVVLTLTMMVLHQRISLRNRQIIQASLNQNGIGGMVKLVRKVFVIVIVFELIGTVFLTLAFYHALPITFPKAIYFGFFHSVCSFCNAGFDIVGTRSLMPFVTNTAINVSVFLLMTAGSLGFIVWAELYESLKNRKDRTLRMLIKHLSLHTKIVLCATVILIISGTLLFMLFEWNNPDTIGGLSSGNKIQASLFQAATVRTCGFNTIDQGNLTEISKAFSCIFMLIGGSPVSTAGGIKTVTIGVIVISMISVLRGKNRMEAFGRTIPFDILQKALAILGLILSLVFAASLALYFTENSGAAIYSFQDILFEVCSATGTVGVTAGITPNLTEAGKAILIVCMFIGRLSPITIVVALNIKLHNNNHGLSFPKERIIVG